MVPTESRLARGGLAVLAEVLAEALPPAHQMVLLAVVVKRSIAATAAPVLPQPGAVAMAAGIHTVMLPVVPNREEGDSPASFPASLEAEVAVAVRNLPAPRIAAFGTLAVRHSQMLPLAHHNPALRVVGNPNLPSSPSAHFVTRQSHASYESQKRPTALESHT